MSIEKIGMLAVELQDKIDARNRAKRSRKVELKRYADETGNYYYPDELYQAERDAGIDAAHADFKVKVRELASARSKLRREIRKFSKQPVQSNDSDRKE